LFVDANPITNIDPMGLFLDVRDWSSNGVVYGRG